MNNEEMTVNKAIEILKDKQSQTNDVKLQNRIDSLISDLVEYFGNSDYVEPEIAKKLNDINTRAFQLDYGWVMDLHEEFIIMKRRSGCRKYLATHNNKIDGETAQWITTFVQGAIGVISILFTFLFALGVIPNVFGVLGESTNSDAFYYIIGTLGQQIVALIIGIVIGIINRIRRKNKYYSNSKYSFEELLAVKYENEPKKLWLLSPAASRMRDCQIAIGNDNRQSQRNKGKAKNGNVYQNSGDVIER